MDGRFDLMTTCLSRRAAARPLLVAFVVALVGFSSSAVAAPIRAHRLSAAATGSPLGPRWTRFLAGGPALWTQVANPPIPSRLRLPILNGQLIETPLVQYLSWRRDLNPARFDAYHPILGPQLARLPEPTISPTILTPEPQTLPPPPFNPQEQNVVPEPGTVLIGLTLASAAFGYHWRVRYNTPSKSA